MTLRFASSLALVSISLCLAEDSFDQTSFEIFEISQESSKPQEAAKSQIDPSLTAPILAPLSIKEWSEHAALGNYRYGCVRSKRVRMRTAAQLDAPVIRELDKGTPLKITSDAGDFYTVIPPLPMKAYVFRTYVLDGKIEGERVNVRLSPSAESPILTQLSSGYPVIGKPSASNPKWLEIDLPSTTRFYISRDYVDIITEEEFQNLVKRFETKESSSSVIQKVKEESPQVVPNNSTEETTELLIIEETVLKPISKQEKVLEKATSTSLNKWQAIEQNIQNQWLLLNAPATVEDYQNQCLYLLQKLKGTVEPYQGPSDAPGDFILRDSGKTVAIIYSNDIDLSNYIEQTIEVKAVLRDNHGYAYPAFCVMQVL